MLFRSNIYNGYATQESLLVEGLQGNTTYYCYLRSFCSAADTSLWTVYELKTPCGTLNSFPININFDGLVHNSVPDCWTVVTGYNGTPSIYNYNNRTPGGTGCLYFGAQQGSFSTIAMQSLGDVDVASLMISFYAYYYNSGPEIQVGIMTDPSDASTFQLVNSHMLRSARTWEPVEVSLSQYTGTGK